MFLRGEDVDVPTAADAMGTAKQHTQHTVTLGRVSPHDPVAMAREGTVQ